MMTEEVSQRGEEEERKRDCSVKINGREELKEKSYV